MILDENGDRAPDIGYGGGHCQLDPVGGDAADLNSNAEIYAAIDRANTILGWYGRGYEFVVVDDILEISEGTDPGEVAAPSGLYCCNDGFECDSSDPGSCPGTCSEVLHWFDVPSACASTASTGLAAAIRCDPATWLWDDTAINVYITGAAFSGVGGRLGALSACGDIDGAVPVILGQALTQCNTPFHEIGHTFHVYGEDRLCHTHGCIGGGSPESSCSGGANDGHECCDSGDCPGGVCDPGCAAAIEDDLICDTLGDNSNWTWDEMAEYHFGTTSLTPEQTQQMCDTYYNLMSYHSIGDAAWDYTYLTQGQLDAITDVSNDIMNDLGIVTGRTRFVDAYATLCPDFSSTETGSSTEPFHTVSSALAAAQAGDIVLIRPGDYEAPASPINQRVFLRASKASVRIGETP